MRSGNCSPPGTSTRTHTPPVYGAEAADSQAPRAPSLTEEPPSGFCRDFDNWVNMGPACTGLAPQAPHQQCGNKWVMGIKSMNRNAAPQRRRKMVHAGAQTQAGSVRTDYFWRTGLHLGLPAPR
eukprot:gene25266-biopygen9015